ncbi:hypothetical protein BDW71DRAFT_198058 [Aspergillus fruticulosus]
MQPLSSSVGSLIQSSKLRKSYWEATGPMRKLFIDELAQTPPSECLSWSMYMRGRTPGKAKPYLVFSSTNEKTRKRALQMVKESGILTAFPTIKLSHTRYPPDMNTLMRLLGDEVLVRRQDAESHTFILGNMFYYIPSDNVMGLQLYVKGLSIEEPVGRATAGGIICVGSSFFYLTVYHILERNEHRQSQQDRRFRVRRRVSDLDDRKSEVEYREVEEEEEEEEVDGFGFEDSAQLSFGRMSTTSDSDSESGDSEGSKELSEEHETGGSVGFTELDADPSFTPQKAPLPSGATQLEYLVSTKLGSPTTIGSESLDYLLIEVQNEDHKKGNRLLQSGNEDRAVIILTASHNISRRTLFATPRFVRLAKATTTRKTFALQLDKYVQPGECGSWVIDEVSGHLYGHIFGGGIGTRTAYITPADDIFEDIRRRSGQPVFLPSAKEESHVESEVKSRSIPSRVLQLDSQQGDMIVPKSMENHGFPKQTTNRSRPTQCNINSSSVELAARNRDVGGPECRRVNAPQLPCTTSQTMGKVTSNKAAQVPTDNSVSKAREYPPTLKMESEPPKGGRAPNSTCSKSFSSPQPKAYLKDEEASLWTYRPKSSRPLFYYAPSSHSAGPGEESEREH